MRLRDYQTSILEQLKARTTNDLVQLDTGAGKTPVEAAMALWAARTIVVAHRVELIQQISSKLAAFGIDHDTISTEHTRRRCMLAHRPYGRNHIVRGHKTHLVASIDSLHAQISGCRLKIDVNLPWLIMIDEAHHVVAENKWGVLRKMFPKARIIGFTATPTRLDGMSLHVSTGGLFDGLIQAPELGADSARKLIARGHLSDFRVYAPGPTTTTRVEHGEIAFLGNPVKEYCRVAGGTKALMMCPSIMNAKEFSEEFLAAGISSSHVSSDQTGVEVARRIDAFRAGEIKVLCNVDMLGEGFDLPSIETLIIANTTRSFVRYRQWVGRVLRPAPGKRHATIIDHVGIICGPGGHGMPDEPVVWDILKPPAAARKMSFAPCLGCGRVYNITETACPDCGVENELLKPRENMGGHYVCLKRLDYCLIEQKKQSIELEKIQSRMQTEVIFPYFSDAGSTGAACKKLRSWFVERLLDAGVPILQINVFLETCKENAFYVKHFTVGDLNVNSPTKALKVYKLWQRSH